MWFIVRGWFKNEVGYRMDSERLAVGRKNGQKAKWPDSESPGQLDGWIAGWRR